MAAESGWLASRSRTNYVLLRGTFVDAVVRVERDGRQLLEIQLHVLPPGPWREPARVKPLRISVFAWSDVVPRAITRTLLAGTYLTVVGHLTVAAEHGLEVFVDALAQDVEGALDGHAPAPAAAGRDAS